MLEAMSCRRSNAVEGDWMKLLICASARAEIVMKCLKEFEQGNDITIVAPSGVGRVLKESEDIGDAVLIPMATRSFSDEAKEELKLLLDKPFDAVIIVSGAMSFPGYDNVLNFIDGLDWNNTLIFYNSAGQKEVIHIPNRFGQRLERYAVGLLYGFWSIIRPAELFVERVYIQCAELLGL